MALAFDAATDGNVAGGNTKTVSHTMGAGANGVLYAFFMWRKTTNSPTSPSATWNGDAMTALDTSNNALNRGISGFVIYAPDSGTHNCVVSWTENTNAAIAVVSFTGAAQTAGYGTIAASSGNDTTPTMSVTGVVGGIILDSVVIDWSAGQTLTVDGSQTQRTQENATTCLGATSTEAGAANVTMSWSASNTNNWRNLGFCVLPFPSGGQYISWTSE